MRVLFRQRTLVIGHVGFTKMQFVDTLFCTQPPSTYVYDVHVWALNFVSNRNSQV